MTRDEHRKACIGAMAGAMKACQDASYTESPWEVIAIAAFDALHGIAWVIPYGTAKGDLTNPPEVKPPVTLKELEDLLNSDDDTPVEILPDGSVRRRLPEVKP